MFALLPHFVQVALDWFCLRGRGYQFWSGIGLPVSAVAAYFRRHNCHERGCPFLIFKPHPDDGDHLLCRRHHRKAMAPGP